MYRAFLDAIDTGCRESGLPQSVFTYEEREKGHEITSGMLDAAMEFLGTSLEMR